MGIVIDQHRVDRNRVLSGARDTDPQVRVRATVALFRRMRCPQHRENVRCSHHPHQRVNFL